MIGRRDRLPAELLRQIERSEQLTAACRGMHLRLAVDYSSRYSIMEAAQRLCGRSRSSDTDFLGLLAAADHSAPAAPAVDLLIRTGGEHRLSDFLLWECAYAELHVRRLPVARFRRARRSHRRSPCYGGRQRRFGRLAAAPPDSALQAHEQI